MDSALSDARFTIDCLREAARRGDWQNAGKLAASLAKQPLPGAPAALAQYLKWLNDALIVAKASRAHAASSLVRLNAAARFQRGALNNTQGRRNFAESTNCGRQSDESGE